MQEIIINLINQFGYFGVFFLIAVENIFPPIPSEVILTFSGFMTAQSKLTIIGVIFFSTLGSVVGAIILYLIGKILNKERLIKIISGKTGKILRLKANDIEKADDWFDKKGNITVFFCRFIPIVRSLISIPAGMSNMNFFKFLLYTIFGSLIWNSVLIILGNRLKENWKDIVIIVSRYSHIVLFIIIILIILLLLIYIKRRRK